MTDWLGWPFFKPRHGELADRLKQWCGQRDFHHGGNVDEECRSLVCELGAAGLLELCTQGDVRSLVIARSALAYQRLRKLRF